MQEHEAIDIIRRHIAERGYSELAGRDLVGERFAVGWTVFVPLDLDADPSSVLVGATIFLVGDDGRIEETSSSLPPGVAEADFTRRYAQS